MLTWEPGVGWARDRFVEVSGETTASTVADTTIRVPAPDGDSSPEEVADDTAEAIRLLEGRFVPFPYPTLTVALVEDDGGGEGFSSSILLGDDSSGLFRHEVAHMWSHGMVGNSQFRDPWLDEAFAGYAESVGDEPGDVGDDLDVRGDVAAAMSDVDDRDDDERRVHGKGAAALWAAREAAGEAAFEEAVRCYADAQAWTIARPDDVARALAGLPAALDVLVEAGALDRQDVEAAAD